MRKLPVLFSFAFLVSLLVTPSALAFDLSGTWLGTIDVRDEGSGTNISTPVELKLSEEGGVLTGKIGRAEDAEVVPLKNVKKEGNKLTFEASNGETMTPCKFVLVVDGDSMQGDMQTSVDAEHINGKVKITRAKK